jgi:hypothetical protein
LFLTKPKKRVNVLRMAKRFPNMAVPHPVLEALERAPVGEPLDPEQRAELDQIMADIASGKTKTVPHAERHAWFLANTPEESEIAAE